MQKIILLLSITFICCAGAAVAQDAESPKLARAGSFQIVKTETGKFHYVLKSSNGQEILKGYQFATEARAQAAIAAVQEAVAGDSNFDPRNEKSQWYFFLKGADGKAIGRSENYTTEAAMKRGIESVKKTALNATVK
jgi:uncharacterized protein YegP (UPF0339 family)